MVAGVLWALLFPAHANGTLGSQLLEIFNGLYIYIVGLFVVFLIVIAVLPKTGSWVMGTRGETPVF